MLDLYNILVGGAVMAIVLSAIVREANIRYKKRPLTIRQLKVMASDAKIKNYGRMNKETLRKELGLL